MRKPVAFIIITGLVAALFFAFYQKHEKAQSQTVTNIHTIGMAWRKWRQDEWRFRGPKLIRISAPTPRYDAVRFTIYDEKGRTLGEPRFIRMSYDEVYQMLVRQNQGGYLEDVPRTDGWGRELEFYRNPDVFGQNSILIRSPGRDGVYSGKIYTQGAYGKGRFDKDIVWMDDAFIQLPKSK